MAWVVSGLLNKQVGAELGMTEATVKAHRGKIMQKMKADSLADLVRIAAQARAPAALRIISLTRPPVAVVKTTTPPYEGRVRPSSNRFATPRVFSCAV